MTEKPNTTTDLPPIGADVICAIYDRLSQDKPYMSIFHKLRMVSETAKGLKPIHIAVALLLRANVR